MLRYSTLNNSKDLDAIIELQKSNLADFLPQEQLSEGCLFMSYTPEQLQAFNQYTPGVIVKDDNVLVAYLLAIPANAKQVLPEFSKILNLFIENNYEDVENLNENNCLLIGQVCIRKDYRGLGILEECYSIYQKMFVNKYQFAIAATAKVNARSIKAHQRLGFKQLSDYTDATGKEFTLLIWDMKDSFQKKAEQYLIEQEQEELV
jgi:hypothetical protein